VVLNGTIEGIRDASARSAPIEPQRIEALETVAEHLLAHARQLDGVGRQGHDGEPTRIELGTAVRETMAMMRAAVAKHARIIVRNPDRALFVAVDRTRLQQVLVNLVYNAVAACEEAGRSAVINVTLEADEHRVACRVADNGPGIAPEIMPNLFDMYFTTKTGGKGSGIGLAVAKSIVEAAGGQITAESQLGDGATFTFTLPLALAQRRDPS
jgi:signal transduction histidine kinase